MEFPRVSVIIPLWAVRERFINNLEQFRKIDYPDFEVYVVSDSEVELPSGPFRLILTGKERTGPAEKRDAALREAHGEILAFIDDDAYPRSDWIRFSGLTKSVTRAAEVLLILVEIVDCAAAKTPATTSPAIPVGSSRAMKSGKIASVLKVGSSRLGLCL